MESVNKELFPNGRWLLCPSTHFDVRYEINPWMSLSRTPASQLANTQWNNLHHHLIRLGAWVEYIMPNAECPDLVFTANAGLIKGKKVILSSFAVKERQAEEPLFENWFNEHGYQVLRVKKGLYEGEGDSLFAGDKLFCGYGFRSTLDAYDSIAELFNVKKTIPCKLLDPRFYHLDTCFAPLNDKKAIFYPEAFDKESIKLMEAEIELIPVCKEDAEHFVCNTVVLGKDLVMPAKCATTYKELEKHGFKCHPVELGEFLKGGGSAKCLTLRLDRE